MSDSSQYSFAGVPQSACPAPEDSGEKAPPESPEKCSESEESGTSVVRVESVKVITPGSSRATSPAGASVDGSGRPVAGGSSSVGARPRAATTVIAATGREELIRPKSEEKRSTSAKDAELIARMSNEL